MTAKVNPKILILALSAVFLATTGLSCKLIPQEAGPKEATQKTALEYWGVWDDADDLQILINDFKALHPNLNITYRKFRYAEYEQKLLEAWAEDRGPDIYSLPATWLKKYQSRITPMPPTVKLAFLETKTTLGKSETTTVVRQIPTLSTNDLKNQFAETVYQDVIIGGKIYGLPYSLDTLVMYYNRKMLDENGVPTAPANWTELAEAVKKITKVDQKNNLLQSGAALGTADNIPRSVDLAALLMMQNGALMTDNQGRAAWQASAGRGAVSPALSALNFYTDFANPLKEVYSWNEKQPNAFEAFVSGKVAMFFGYAYYLPLIKTQAPKIDLGIMPMMQIQGAAKPVNYTDYWVETVAHKAKNPEAAWGFLNFAASPGEAEKYLNKTKRPTALRALIEKQKADPEMSVFANQILTAAHWYRGRDPLKMEEFFKDMLRNLPNTNEPEKLLDTTAKNINQTL